MKRSLPLATALAALLGAAAPAAADTLEEALAAAYVTNPTLQAARAELRSVDEQVPQALSGWRPTVQLSGDAGYAYGRGIRPESPPGTTNPHTQPRSAGISLRQPVFTGFRVPNQIDTAEYSVLAARENLASVEQTVLLDAATAYMDVLRDMAVLDLTVNNEEVLRRQLEATQDRFQVGEITRTDVSQAESRLAGAIAQRIEAEGTLQATRAAYEREIGMPPVNLEPPDAIGGLPASREEALDMADEEQPQVRAAAWTARAAKEQVDATQSELWPSVDLEASYFRNWDSSATVRESESAVVRLNATVPLYQSGVVYSQIREAKHTFGQRRQQVDEARRAARAQAVQAWEALTTARAQIDSIVAQVEAAEVALEGVRREAQVGARTVLDVLDAEQELLDARVTLVEARRNERVAALTLLAAVGRLNARALGLAVPVYVPEEHYEEVRDRWFGGGILVDYDEEVPVVPEVR